MLFWLLIFIGAILLYVAICFVIDKWLVQSDKEMSIPMLLFIAPLLFFLNKKEQWVSSREGKATGKKVAGKPYNISESTIRRIEKEGITYRDKD